MIYTRGRRKSLDSSYQQFQSGLTNAWEHSKFSRFDQADMSLQGSNKILKNYPLDQSVDKRETQSRKSSQKKYNYSDTFTEYVKKDPQKSPGHSQMIPQQKLIRPHQFLSEMERLDKALRIRNSKEEIEPKRHQILRSLKQSNTFKREYSAHDKSKGVWISRIPQKQNYGVHQIKQNLKVWSNYMEQDRPSTSKYSKLDSYSKRNSGTEKHSLRAWKHRRDRVNSSSSTIPSTSTSQSSVCQKNTENSEEISVQISESMIRLKLKSIEDLNEQINEKMQTISESFASTDQFQTTHY